MTRSFSQTVELHCVACGREFSTEVWLIVEAQERPDLVAAIESERLHVVQCPHCGTEHPLDAPLLFHDAAARRLIFATQEHSTAEQDQDVARQLGQQLIAAIPVEERDVYLTSAQTVVGADGLRRQLSGETELEGDELTAGLRTLMEAATPQEVQAAADKHPILTTDDGITQLREYARQLRDAEHADLAAALEQRIEALRPSPPHPTLQLIQALLDAPSPEERHDVLASRPHDVTPEVPTILEALADQAQRRHLDAVARDMLVIRDEVLHILGRAVPVTPSA